MRITLEEAQREETRMRSLHSAVFLLKLLTFLVTTTLQRCKLIYAFEGGLRGFDGTAACTILISSRTMSVQSRAISHTLPERTPFIILLPLRKNKRARKVGKLPFFRLRQLHHIHTLNIWNSMLKLRDGRRPPCNPCRGRSGYAPQSGISWAAD